MYFISIDNKKEGPFTLEEVLAMRLTDDMLVWKEGIAWSKISELPELIEVVIKTPPPLPFEIKKAEKDNRNKQKFENGKQILIRNALWGIAVALFLCWLLSLYCESGGTNEYPIYHGYGKNHWDDFFWGLFPYSLLISEVLLLIIGFIEIGVSKPDDDQVKIKFHYNTDKGNIIILQSNPKVIVLDNYVFLESKIVDEVLINPHYAPDGKYNFLGDNCYYYHYINVIDGKVTDLLRSENLFINDYEGLDFTINSPSLPKG